jgi:hypothetical protein
MSFDKSIESGQEHRKEYRKSKRFDKTCRNHGSCSWCRSDKLYQFNKEVERTEKELKEYYDNRDY